MILEKVDQAELDKITELREHYSRCPEQDWDKCDECQIFRDRLVDISAALIASAEFCNVMRKLIEVVRAGVL